MSAERAPEPPPISVPALSAVRFENYRGFTDFKLVGIKRVNLIVGRNSCGKTALMEGIQFLASGGDPRVLHAAAMRRGEVVTSPADNPGGSTRLGTFFAGRTVSSDSRLTIGTPDGSLQVVIRLEEQVPAEDFAKREGFLSAHHCRFVVDTV